jgi:hypothetical protein
MERTHAAAADAMQHVRASRLRPSCLQPANDNLIEYNNYKMARPNAAE